MRANSSLVPGWAVLATGVALVAAVFIAPDFATASEPSSIAAAPSVSSPTPSTEADATATLEPFGDPAPAAEPRAGGDPQSAAPSCSCPEGREKSARPKFAGLVAGPSSALDESDELAALASVHLALTTVGDGAAYVWARSNGRLSGLVRPVSSFRNDEGQICRHLVVMLTTGRDTRKTESTACRLPGGRWQLGG